MVHEDVLMGVDNHDGWTLEELLGQLIKEISAKTRKIVGVDHPQRDMIMWHNQLIVGNLEIAMTIQKETYAQMDALAPNKGPSEPRL